MGTNRPENTIPQLLLADRCQVTAVVSRSLHSKGSTGHYTKPINSEFGQEIGTDWCCSDAAEGTHTHAPTNKSGTSGFHSVQKLVFLFALEKRKN
jgi:hypothetical protein